MISNNFNKNNLKAFIISIVFFITILICSFSCTKNKPEPKIPTATTVEFEGEWFIIFYDYKGEICGILPYNDECD